MKRLVGYSFSSRAMISVLAQWLRAVVNDFAGIGIFHLFEVVIAPVINNPDLLHELLEFYGPVSTTK